MRRYIGNNLSEFERLDDNAKIDLDGVNAVLAALPLKQLGAIPFSPVFFRKALIGKWIQEVESVLGTKIELRIVKEEAEPYMQESGILCFSSKDIKRSERLIMLLSHELAHFILLRDGEYSKLKAFDAEYRCENKENAKMLSPVEYCANLITLIILKRCENAVKTKRKRSIITAMSESLKKQLTLK